MKPRFLHLRGHSDYAAVHAWQQQLVAQRAAGEIGDTVLLLEHAETITLGRKRGAQANVLDAGDVPVVAVERGGDVTWHGPGQLVAYPIVLLQGRRADLHLHLRSLEEAVIGLCAQLGLSAGRDPRNTGVWLPSGHADARKVCSIGIAARKWVSWHGLALNVTVDLDHFRRIQPCGFDPAIMTTLSEWLDPCPGVHQIAEGLGRELARTLELEWTGLVSTSAAQEVPHG